jgi:hypothetical protein
MGKNKNFNPPIRRRDPRDRQNVKTKAINRNKRRTRNDHCPRLVVESCLNHSRSGVALRLDAQGKRKGPHDASANRARHGLPRRWPRQKRVRSTGLTRCAISWPASNIYTTSENPTRRRLSKPGWVPPSSAFVVTHTDQPSFQRDQLPPLADPTLWHILRHNVFPKSGTVLVDRR